MPGSSTPQRGSPKPGPQTPPAQAGWCPGSVGQSSWALEAMTGQFQTCLFPPVWDPWAGVLSPPGALTLTSPRGTPGINNPRQCEGWRLRGAGISEPSQTRRQGPGSSAPPGLRPRDPLPTCPAAAPQPLAIGTQAAWALLHCAGKFHFLPGESSGGLGAGGLGSFLGSPQSQQLIALCVA